MSEERQNVLVAGANGTTGRMIIELLQKSETYRPIAMVRKKEQQERFEKDNVDTVLVDLAEDFNLNETQVDKVIFAAGSKGKNLIGVDQEGAKRLIDKSKQLGVKKFVMLSSMGADEPSKNQELKDYLKAKKNADDHLRSSGINYTIVRPGHLINEEGDGKIKLQEKLEEEGKISRSDVARTLVEVLKDGIKQDQVFEIIAGEVPVEQAVRSF
jgi:uncharacterized protein YbjT (DUF2867 family)